MNINFLGCIPTPVSSRTSRPHVGNKICRTTYLIVLKTSGSHQRYYMSNYVWNVCKIYGYRARIVRIHLDICTALITLIKLSVISRWKTLLTRALDSDILDDLFNTIAHKQTVDKWLPEAKSESPKNAYQFGIECTYPRGAKVGIFWLEKYETYVSLPQT